MALEIERQFLVRARLLPPLTDGHRIEQAYLAAVPEVRVRLIDDAAFITVKSDGTISRAEFEYAVPPADAGEMLKLTPWSVITKTRFHLSVDGRLWEIDRYEGENAGLWSAEVELASAGEDFLRPQWLADEVTYQPRFKNKNLSRRPFATWADRERFLRVIEA